MDSKTRCVGLVGFGTIGTGVAKILLGNAEQIAAKTGLDIVLKRACDIDVTRDRGVTLPDGRLTANVEDVLGDPEIEVVMELVGGTTFARELVLRALAAGKSVVTANNSTAVATSKSSM